MKITRSPRPILDLLNLIFQGSFPSMLDDLSGKFANIDLVTYLIYDHGNEPVCLVREVGEMVKGKSTVLS
jgi:hypothetical protein